MLRIDPKIGGVDVVLLGDFNPAIFSPRWFSAHGLLPDDTADTADVQVIHPELTDFTADWVRVQVTQERFVAGTVQAPYARVRQLVHRVFREHLFDTPLRAFGINFSVHFLVDSSAARDRIGNTLAPVEPWGPWRDELDLDASHGGMTSLKMSQLKPAGRANGGAVNIVVEPSSRVGRDGRGVFVRVNDHFIADDDAVWTAESLMATLDAEFEGSVARSHRIVDHVMSLAGTRKGRQTCD